MAECVYIIIFSFCLPRGVKAIEGDKLTSLDHQENLTPWNMR
jgi:hypothetical protein